MIQDYLKKIATTTSQGDAREESYYAHLSSFIEIFADNIGKKKTQITTLPKKTEAGNPDFRICDGKQSIVGSSLIRKIILMALHLKYGTTQSEGIKYYIIFKEPPGNVNGRPCALL